ncbi:MAG: hypothetical protein K1W06_08220 [Lachnospiraceae bacterium]
MEEEKDSFHIPEERKQSNMQTGAGTSAKLRNFIKNMPDNLFLCVVLEEGYGKKEPV